MSSVPRRPGSTAWLHFNSYLRNQNNSSSFNSSSLLQPRSSTFFLNHSIFNPITTFSIHSRGYYPFSPLIPFVSNPLPPTHRQLSRPSGNESQSLQLHPHPQPPLPRAPPLHPPEPPRRRRAALPHPLPLLGKPLPPTNRPAPVLPQTRVASSLPALQPTALPPGRLLPREVL